MPNDTETGIITTGNCDVYVDAGAPAHSKTGGFSEKDITKARDEDQSLYLDKADTHANPLVILRTLRSKGNPADDTPDVDIIRFIDDPEDTPGQLSPTYARLVQILDEFNVYDPDEEKLRQLLAEYIQIIQEKISLNPFFDGSEIHKMLTLRFKGDGDGDRFVLDMLNDILLTELEDKAEEAAKAAGSEIPALRITDLHSDHGDAAIRGTDIDGNLFNTRSSRNNDIAIERKLLPSHYKYSAEELKQRRWRRRNLIDYDITETDADGKISGLNFFSHAVAGPKALRATAKAFGVAYDDRTAENLCQTIEHINAKFRTLMSEPDHQKYKDMIKQESETPDSDGVPRTEKETHILPFPEKNPLITIMFRYKSKPANPNSDDISDLWPEKIGDARINAFCGHVGEDKTPDKTHSLDANAGKVVVGITENIILPTGSPVCIMNEGSRTPALSSIEIVTDEETAYNQKIEDANSVTGYYFYLDSTQHQIHYTLLNKSKGNNAEKLFNGVISKSEFAYGKLKPLLDAYHITPPIKSIEKAGYLHQIHSILAEFHRDQFFVPLVPALYKGDQNEQTLVPSGNKFRVGASYHSLLELKVHQHGIHISDKTLRDNLIKWSKGTHYDMHPEVRYAIEQRVIDLLERLSRTTDPTEITDLEQSIKKWVDWKPAKDLKNKCLKDGVFLQFCLDSVSESLKLAPKIIELLPKDWDGTITSENKTHLQTLAWLNQYLKQDKTGVSSKNVLVIKYKDALLEKFKAAKDNDNQTISDDTRTGIFELIQEISYTMTKIAVYDINESRASPENKEKYQQKIQAFEPQVQKAKGLVRFLSVIDVDNTQDMEAVKNFNTWFCHQPKEPNDIQLLMTQKISERLKYIKDWREKYTDEKYKVIFREWTLCLSELAKLQVLMEKSDKEPLDTETIEQLFSFLDRAGVFAQYGTTERCIASEGIHLVKTLTEELSEYYSPQTQKAISDPTPLSADADLSQDKFASDLTSSSHRSIESGASTNSYESIYCKLNAERSSFEFSKPTLGIRRLGEKIAHYSLREKIGHLWENLVEWWFSTETKHKKLTSSENAAPTDQSISQLTPSTSFTTFSEPKTRFAKRAEKLVHLVETQTRSIH